MEIEKTGQNILTLWLSTTNGAEPHEKTFFARKPRHRSLRLSSQENPPKREKSNAKHQDKGLSGKGNPLVKNPCG